MINLSEKGLADYLTHRDESVNGRLIAHRMFRGTIQTVSRTGTAFLVTIKRTGDSSTDQTTYFCNVPGYVPAINDVVDLIWRTKKEAVVLQPVTAIGPPRMHATYASTLTLTTAVWATIPLVADYDNTGQFNSTTHVFTVPVTGYYFMMGRARSASTTTSVGVRFNKNSGTFIGTMQATGAGTATEVSTVDIFLLQAGDTITLEMEEQAATGSQTIFGVMTIHFMSA